MQGVGRLTFAKYLEPIRTHYSEKMNLLEQLTIQTKKLEMADKKYKHI